MARRPAHDDDELPSEGGPREAALVIAQTISEIAPLARRHGLDVLGFLLDMALLEAREMTKTPDGQLG